MAGLSLSLMKKMLDVSWARVGVHGASPALSHTPCLSLSPGSSALMESLINPLQDRIEDWKKTANQLDKDHAKGMGRMVWIHAGGLHWSAGGGPL